MEIESIVPLLLALSVGLNVYVGTKVNYKELFQKKKKIVMRDKINTVMEEGEAKGCIKSTERKLVENVLDFKEKTAEDVMIHRGDVTMISLNATHKQVMGYIQETGLSRYPVYNHNADDIVGILATRKYLLARLNHPEKKISDIIYPAYFVPKTVGTEPLLRDMQGRKTHMSIVVDEYGGVSGIVSLEDLLEEIVGNIYDEFDPQVKQEIIQISEDCWRVAGSAHIDEVAWTLGISLPPEEVDFDTVGGLVLNQLDVLPTDGNFPKVTAYNMEIQVETMLGRRIQWVIVRVLNIPSSLPSLH